MQHVHLLEHKHLQMVQHSLQCSVFSQQNLSQGHCTEKCLWETFSKNRKSVEWNLPQTKLASSQKRLCKMPTNKKTVQLKNHQVTHWPQRSGYWATHTQLYVPIWLISASSSASFKVIKPMIWSYTLSMYSIFKPYQTNSAIIQTSWVTRWLSMNLDPKSNSK